MAQNNALTFYVSFMEDQNNTINKLVGELAKQLKSMVVHLDSKNIDVSGLKTELGKLEGAKVVDQESLTKAKSSIKEIAELLDKAFNGGTKGGEKFPGLLQSLKDINTAIGKVVNKMGEMHTAISSIGSGMSTNVGNAIVNNMTQIVEATGRAISKVQELNELAGKNLGGKRAHKEEEKIIPPTLGLSSTNFKSEAEQIMKTYEEVEKRMQQKIKSIQDTIAKFPKDTFIKNPVNRDWMKQEMDDVERLQRHLLSLLGVIEKFSTVQTPNRIIKFDEPVKQMTAEERNARQWMYNSLFNSREAIAMQNSVDTAGMEKARTKAAEIRKQMDKINEAIARTNDQSLIQGATAAHQRLEKIHSELESISKTGGSSGGKSYAEYSKGTDIKEAVSQGDKVVKDINAAVEKAHKESEEIKRKRIQGNKDAADAELQRLRKIMRELNSIQAKSPKLQIEGMDKAKQELQTLIELLQRAKKEGTSISGIDFGKFGYSNVNATLAELSRNQQTAALDAMQHAQAQQRMEQAIASATGKAQQQSQVLSDLRSMAAQYLSVWGATSFIKEIAQITGELELQQRSLEVIIGSAGQAQEMFNNIKGLSQMSPFTFQDLLKSTRQLAAFGVETKDLYGTMKSLSDLGAGLNVDVQRLILAYGHVKSAGVLSGIQRRQFETAGINITGEIAKLYNQRYERAGSDERVTNADIFKKITKREIGFEDVEEAIRNLTSEGGKFYNMQLRQYETLGGKLRNLRNNYNIMLDDIGKRYMEVFTGGVDALNSMMENWRTWGALIKSVTAALVAAKVASLAFGKSMAGHRAASLTLMRDRINAQHLAALQGNAGTIGRNSMLFNRRTMLGMDYAGAINGSEMSKFQKIRSALYANVAPDAKNAILTQQNMGKEYIANIRRLSIMANSTQTMTRLQGQWGLAFERLKVSANGFFASMRAGFAALATNPMVWIGAAIAGITALVNKANEIETAMEHSTENTKRVMKEDIENINSSLNPIKKSLFDDNGNFNKEALDKRGFQATFEELDEIMQNHDPLYKGHLFDIKQMGDEAEIIKGMISDIEDVKEGKQMASRNIGAVNAANADTGYSPSMLTLGIDNQWSTLTEKMSQAEKDYEQMKARLVISGDEIETRLKEKMPAVYDRWKASGMEFEDFMAQLSLEMAAFGSSALEKNMKDDFFGELSDLGKYHTSLKNLMYDIDGVKNKVGDVAKVIAKGFDPGKTLDQNVIYLKEQMQNLFNTEGFDIKNPEMQEFFTQIILANLPDDSMAPVVRESLYEFMLKANLNEVIQQAIKDGKVDPNNIDDDAISFIESRYNVMANRLQNSNADNAVRKVIADKSASIFSAFKSDPTPAIRDFDRSWQKLYTSITDPNDPRKWITTHLGVDIHAYTDETSYWIDINKKIAELKKKTAAIKAVLPVTLTAKLNVDAIVDTKSAARAVLQAYDNMVAAYNKGDFKGVLGLKDVLDALYDIYKGFKAAGMTGHRIHDDSNKGNKGGGGHKSDSGKSKGGKGGKSKGGSGKDPEEEQWQADLKRIREFINTAKEANSEYKKYRKTMNETAALQELIDNYKYWELIGPGKLLTEDDLRNIENFASIVKKAEAEIKKIEPRANKKGKPKRKEDLEELRRQAAKADSDVKMTLFNEESERQLSSISTKLEDLTRKWETFNKVLEKTGDEELASKLSGMSRLLGTADLWSVYHTGSALEDIDLGFISAIDWKKIAGMSDESLEKEAVNILGEKETAAKVKALIEVFKNVKKAYNDLEKEIVNAIDTATSDAVDSVSVEKRLEQGLSKITSLIAESEALSPEEKALLTNRERAKKRHEELTKSNEYARFESNAEGMSPAEFNSIYERVRKDLLTLLDNRLITVDDFAKKIKDLRDKRSEYEIKQFSKITDLTLDSRLERNLAKALADEQKKVAAYEKANAEYEDTQIEYKRLTNIETQVVNKRKEAKALRDDAFWAKNRGEITKAELLTQKADRLEAEADALNIEAENAKAEIKNLNLKLPGLKAARDDAKEAADEAGKEVKKRQGQKDDESKSKATVSNVVNSLNKFKEALDFVSGILDSFGLDAAFTEDTSSVIGGMVNGATTVDGIAKAFGAAGPWGAVAGAALGLAGQLAQIHDKNLQRRIDEIKEDTTKMNNTLESIRSLRERQLGYDNGDLRRALAAQYGVQNSLPKSTSVEDILAWIALEKKSSGSADSAMREYYTRYSNGSGYEQELELLKGQREKIMEMYDLESKKKKKSKEELENYKQQIADLDEQIMFFTEDLANSLWGIDLKGWADQFGDALMTAFENGTSAASAFKDSVQDIMRDVTKNMLTVGVIEPALEKLRVRLFGKDGNGGVFKGSQENIGAVLSELGNWFENEGPALMDAANEFYNGADNMMRQILGYGMRESEKSTSAVSSITSTASEETMGIVAGYLSRLSQDVSVQRIMQEMFVNGSWPDYVEQVTNANDSLSAIDRSTTAMMEMMRDGNGALYERVENMSRRLDNFANGIDTITMR